MKVLVIGSRGFIGQHVVAYFRGAGQPTIGADIARHGDPDYILIDPRLPDFEGLFRSAAVDVVVNCAGAASVPASFDDPLGDFELNTLRVAQMLAALRAVDSQARFINLSSAAVYGNPKRAPIRESDEIRPLSPYGWHKAQAESICKEHHDVYGRPTLSLRIFSAFGPGLRKQLFWDVYQKVRLGGPLKLYGTGEETRDFIYVEDIAKCLDLVLQSGTFDGRALNLASGSSVSVRTAVSSFLTALGTPRELLFSGTERVGDPARWQADVTQIKALGFAPRHTLEEGLEKVALWLQRESPAGK